MKKLLVTILFMSLFIISCTNDDNPLNPNERKLPPLEDEIPYDFLRSGKIVFERTSPYPGEVFGFFIIDIEQQKTWGIRQGLSSDVCISPEGERIIYSHYTNSQTYYDLYITNIYGENLKQLTNKAQGERSPSWNVNGNMVIFQGSENGFEKIFSLNMDEGTVATIKECNNLLPSNYIPSGRMSISSDNRITYVSNTALHEENTGGLYMMNNDGTEFEVLVYAPVNTYFESPDFSPDDQIIVFLSIKRDLDWRYESMQILLFNLVDSVTSKIYESDINGDEWAHGSTLNPIWICWSPDGNKLLFNKPVADFTSHLFAINKDGSSLTQITSLNGVTDRNVSWSY